MPVTITNPLDLETQTREVEIAVDPADPALGTVRILLREIPHGKWVSLLATGKAAAQTRAAEGAALFEKFSAGTITEAEADRLGAIVNADEAAVYEQIRWGVAGHVAEDFIEKGASVPFVGKDATYLGQPYRVAADKDLRLYRVAGKGAPFQLGTILAALLVAVIRFQSGEVATPAEQWAKAEG